MGNTRRSALNVLRRFCGRDVPARRRRSAAVLWTAPRALAYEQLEARTLLTTMQVTFQFSSSQTGGTPLSSLTVGQDVYLQATVQDPNAQPGGFGVYQAYLDVGYNSQLLSPVGSTFIDPGSFDLATSGSAVSSGLQNAGGQDPNADISGNSTVLLFSAEFRVAAQGNGSLALDPGLGSPAPYIFGGNSLQASDIAYASNGFSNWTIPVYGGPAVTGISPIAGTDFTGATAIDFGTAAATSFTVNSATQITATSPAGSGTVDVTVVGPTGTSATSAADHFSYVAAPAVSGVNPTTGPTSGGTTVTITGTNLSTATMVDFGTTVATSFTVNSATQITATSPAGTGTVDVTVVTPGGTSPASAADHFSYVAAPAVNGVSPIDGAASGGTTVTITGTNLSNATAVDFGTTAATAFDVVSATQITATSPAGTGVVDVTVTTAGGTSPMSAADHYSYVPAVTSVNADIGPASGGTDVTIGGFGFTRAMAVDFGTAAATNVTYVSATQITATSPAGAGVVDVTATTTGETSPIARPADQFSYIPAVTSVTPDAGPASGGTNVTINGTGFVKGTTTMDFGTAAATNVTYVSATQITATSPAGTGTVDVTVTTPGGTSTTSAADKFSYIPAVTSVTPDAGPATGDTDVTINGASYVAGATTVDFGTVAATNVTYVSPSQITATSPAGAGVVDVTVTTTGGTSPTSAADKFSYTPVVSGVSPDTGTATGDTNVTIGGFGFTGATAVDFGSTAASTFNVVSATEITATSPAGAGVVDVTVTTTGGTSPTSAADKFSYTPAVSGVSPDTGPVTGDTDVTINGVGFTDATAVNFGTTAATNVTFVSATQITATSPAGAGTVDVTVTTPGGTSPTSSADQFTYTAAATNSLSGYVYIDANDTGERQAAAGVYKTGVGGTTISLYVQQKGTYTWQKNVLTDENGSYQFGSLAAGTYQLTETAPAKCRDGIDTPGSIGGQAGNDQISDIVLGSNEQGTEYDFGHWGLRMPYVSQQLFLSSTPPTGEPLYSQCINNVPVVALNGAQGNDYSARFTAGGGAVAVVNAAAATITHADQCELASLRVTVTNAENGSSEVLSADASQAGTNPDGSNKLTWNYAVAANVGTGTLTGIASTAEYQSVLRTITYNNTATDPDTEPRTITFVASDGTANSAVATTTLTVAASGSSAAASPQTASNALSAGLASPAVDQVLGSQNDWLDG